MADQKYLGSSNASSAQTERLDRAAGQREISVKEHKQINISDDSLQYKTEIHKLIWSVYLSPLVPEELPSVFDDLFIRQKAVRLLFAQGENLPEGHTERPHITGSGELPLGLVDSKKKFKPSRHTLTYKDSKATDK